jgi:hypothetical protein
MGVSKWHEYCINLKLDNWPPANTLVSEKVTVKLQRHNALNILPGHREVLAVT